MSEDRPKRQRRAPSRIDTGGDTAGVDLAIRKSLAEQRRQEAKLSEAPVFRPTSAQFRDPLAFLASIRDAGERSGIVRIVPPADWPHVFVNPLAHSHLVFETKRQHLHRLQEGRSFDDGNHYTFADYREQAVSSKAQWLATHPRPAGVTEEQHLEQIYWRLVECCDEELVVDYANDLDTSVYGSGFSRRQDGTRCSWDLNGLIDHPENVLRAVDSTVAGVTQPWLYFGTQFATFCWHKEDHHLYSVNYLHHGESKTWYAVPGSAAKTFEKALRQSVPRLFEEEPDLLHSLTTMLPPSACAANGVALVHTVQHAGEFVVTFPEAFHAGFSHGFNCAEAVNIGDAEWLRHGRAAVESYRLGPGRRPATFSHERLLWKLAQCCRGMAGTVAVPQRAHRHILQEARVLAQEHLHLRDWLLRNGCIPVLPTSLAATGGDEECYVCGTLPFLAAVRCRCSPGVVTCLQHGFAMCDCKGHNKLLEMRIENGAFVQLLAPHAAAAAGAGYMLPTVPIVNLPADVVAAPTDQSQQGKQSRPQFKPNPRFVAPDPNRCSECGGHGERLSLLRCVACDCAFHSKCGNMRSRSTAAELCLCPSCYNAQF